MAHRACDKTLYALLKIEIISYLSVADRVNVTVQRPGNMFSPYMLYRPFFKVCPPQGLVVSLYNCTVESTYT